MQFYDGWFDVGYGLVIVGLIISLWGIMECEVHIPAVSE